MPSNKAELAARIAAAQPGDSVRGLFFKTVFHLIQQHAGLFLARAQFFLRCETPSATERLELVVELPMSGFESGQLVL